MKTVQDIIDELEKHDPATEVKVFRLDDQGGGEDEEIRELIFVPAQPWQKYPYISIR